MRRRMRLVTGALLAGAVAVWAGCSDEGPAEPQLGSLDLLLLMDGTDVDADGGQVVIDGTVAGPIFEDITTTFEELEPGVYVVELTGIDSNCTILGDNPRNVRVRPGEGTSEEFTFLCEPVGGKGGDGGGGRPPS